MFGLDLGVVKGGRTAYERSVQTYEEVSRGLRPSCSGLSIIPCLPAGCTVGCVVVYRSFVVNVVEGGVVFVVTVVVVVFMGSVVCSPSAV